MQRLLPEWASQEAVLLAWPDAKTDWAPWLEQARFTYLELIGQLNQANTPVIMLIKPEEIVHALKYIEKWNVQQHGHVRTTQGLSGQNIQDSPSISQLLLLPAAYNDTWLRDYGFITCETESGMQALDFHFNGWGNKFDAQLDTQATSHVFADLMRTPPISVDFTLEGGALEIDGAGHLLSTQLCLSNPERNGEWDEQRHIELFSQTLGATKVTILQHGHLEGDDTDGHIDTLVRFTPDASVVIQSCFNRPDDAHFVGLNALVDECDILLKPSAIFELPLPHIVNEANERLPASYANYLISNDHIFAPVYGEPEDAQALDVLHKAYPDFQVVPIDCRTLVQQFGSLHCITMQVPCGTLKSDVIKLAQSGISVYE